MKRKIFVYLITGIFFVTLSLCGYSDAFAEDFNRGTDFYLTLTTKERNDLFESKKDPAVAAIISGLCFGTGQIYAGDITRGLTVMGIGLGLTIGSFGIILPEFNKRPDTASALGKYTLYVLLGLYYFWNIRDAYYETVNYNEAIDKKILISD